MYISKIKIYNFRLLREVTLDLENQEIQDLSIIVGRNNSGKTSFIMLFDKFLGNTQKFNFYDFPISVRKDIFDINEGTDIHNISIKLILEISYSKQDDLANLSEFILDLNPEENKVYLLFECYIDKTKLLKDLSKLSAEDKPKFIKNNLGNYLSSKRFSFDSEEALNAKDRRDLVEKDKNTIDNLINYQVIHAKRNISSSESGENSKQVLSSLATSYFNKKSKDTKYIDGLDKINSLLTDMDRHLEEPYKKFFDDFLNQSKDILNMGNLRVVSDLESKQIISNHSKIEYGSGDGVLPEYLNGLGYMNILYLLLQLEVKKEYLIEGNKDINLLFIEEPEAHTHPQMQTVFIDKIYKILSAINKPLQTFITTHSSHIVKRSDFKTIRYFYHDELHGVLIKNFYTELKDKYESEEATYESEEATYKDGKAAFRFLKEYISIVATDLFFAEKVIFIEGVTETMLLPYFIQQYDNDISNSEDKLSSQNISIVEAGANARAFSHFIEFLGIKTLIITDIDAVQKKEEGNRVSYPKSSVRDSTHISNYTIKYFYKAPKYQKQKEWDKWFADLKQDKRHIENSKLRLAYQIEENGYHGRSFEESFISVNIDELKSNILKIEGLIPNAKEELNGVTTATDFYQLTEKILDKKTAFASSILWLALTQDIKWNMPLYIKNGLAWIAKD